MNIKEKVMSQVLLGPIDPNTQKYALIKIAIEKTLEEVGKEIDEEMKMELEQDTYDKLEELKKNIGI